MSAVLSVVEPISSGLGGGGFFLLHDAKTGRDVFVDAREIAPASATPDKFLNVEGKRYGVVFELANYQLIYNPALLKGGEPPFKRCRRGIGRTYQVPRPYSGMTTFENLLVAAMFGGMQSERVANDRCAAILDDCGLGDKANQLAGSLTLLDRKRLELARALASGPKLLLLDEIAGGLTDEESHALVQLVRRIRERQVTVVWIEHVLHALMAVADRLLVLNFGEKIAEGSPQAVMANPEVQRVYMGIDS